MDKLRHAPVDDEFGEKLRRLVSSERHWRPLLEV